MTITYAVFSSSDVKNANIITVDELKVERSKSTTKNNFKALTWVLTKIRPLMEQGIIPTDEVLTIHVPVSNIFSYLPESAKVPLKYAQDKVLLDTELDFFPFEIEFIHDRKLMNKIPVAVDPLEVIEEENIATNFLASLK